MTTTELIELLKETEHDFIGRSRVISLSINGKFMPDVEISRNSTGSGCAGPEICLSIKGEYKESDNGIA